MMLVPNSATDFNPATNIIWSSYGDDAADGDDEKQEHVFSPAASNTSCGATSLPPTSVNTFFQDFIMTNVMVMMTMRRGGGG